MKAGKGMS